MRYPPPPARLSEPVGPSPIQTRASPFWGGRRASLQAHSEEPPSPAEVQGRPPPQTPYHPSQTPLSPGDPTPPPALTGPSLRYPPSLAARRESYNNSLSNPLRSAENASPSAYNFLCSPLFAPLPPAHPNLTSSRIFWVIHNSRSFRQVECIPPPRCV